ncbi:LexA family transcriptional regulator [Gallibacterium anatis]|uniref:Transcriptional regulator n=3 Tax=Gallibacterium anatis TaxID=750 RepID=U1I7S2_9PAST|nr:S24 family peptidase [Gallibacterium anatis]ERF79475.1 transcriptional regulator [Gallibacterium anatis 12656/12]
MSMSTKKKALTTEQKRECAELKKIFEEKKEALNLSQAEVAEYFGMSQSAINHYLNGINALNAYIATKFAKLLKVTVSAFSERLAIEIAEMAKTIDKEEIALLASTKNEGEKIIIDVLNVEASAGNGSVGDLVEVVSRLYYVPEQYYTLFRGINPEGLRVINIKGDSMAPTFNSGDMIFVDINTQTFEGDGVYIFNYKNALYVKRLQRAGEKFLVLSDNPTYREWEINDESQLFIQGKVIVHQSQKLNFIG